MLVRIVLISVLVFAGGCLMRPISKEDASLIRVTCAPEFVYQSTEGTDLSNLEGDDLIPFRQWLILDDGCNRYKLRWPTPGVSPGSLMTTNTYTFVLSKQGSRYTIVKPITKHD